MEKAYIFHYGVHTVKTSDDDDRIVPKRKAQFLFFFVCFSVYSTLLCNSVSPSSQQGLILFYMLQPII